VPDARARPRPAWTRAELAWPLSLFGGFAGTWAGIELGAPGAAVVLAAGALAPLFLAFQSRGEPKSAFTAALGGSLGSAAAVLGLIFEGEHGTEVPGLLLARLLRNELAGLFADAPTPRPGVLILRHAGALTVAVALARATRGLSALLFALALCGATAAAVGEQALAASDAGAHRLLATVVAWPPGALAEAFAALALGVALSVPRGAAIPRGLMQVGILCAALSVVAWLCARPWGLIAAEGVGHPAFLGR
jgi:hypothetical protein